MLEANQFVKTTNSITDKVEEHPPAIQDMEAIVAIHGEFDKYAIDDWLTQALTDQRTALLTELREHVNQIAYHDDWDCHVLDYDKIQAHFNNLINPTNI